MEQFNPCLRNFVAMGKNYEKALASKSCFFSLPLSLRFILPVLFSAGSGTQPNTAAPDLATCGPFCFTEMMMFILSPNGRVLSRGAHAPSTLGDVYYEADPV